MTAQQDRQRECRADSIEALADRLDDLPSLGGVSGLRRLAAQAGEVLDVLEEAVALCWALDALPDAEEAVIGLQAHMDTLRVLADLDHVADQAVELARDLRRVCGLSEDLRFAADEARSEDTTL